MDEKKGCSVQKCLKASRKKSELDAIDKNGVLNSGMLKSRGEEWRDRMLEKKRARVGSVQLRNDKKRERTAWFMRTTWFLRDGLAQEDRDMVHS